MAEGSPALVGFVTQQHVRQEEPGDGGDQGEDGDESEGSRDPHDHQGSGGEVGDEESGDGSEELVERVPFRCAPDQLEFLVVAFGVVAERFDQASCRAADPVELVARCRCRRVDGDARPSESGEDRVDARRPGASARHVSNTPSPTPAPSRTMTTAVMSLLRCWWALRPVR